MESYVTPWPTDRQLKYCWDIMDEMLIGHSVKISDQAPNFPALFIQAAKCHIDCFNEHHFNKNYSILRKIGNPFKK